MKVCYVIFPEIPFWDNSIIKSLYSKLREINEILFKFQSFLKIITDISKCKPIYKNKRGELTAIIIKFWHLSKLFNRLDKWDMIFLYTKFLFYTRFNIHLLRFHTLFMHTISVFFISFNRIYPLIFWISFLL